MTAALGSLFSGIGGIDLAFQRAGFDIAFQVEIDDFCNRVLSKHWPNVPRFGDIRAVKGSGLPAIDVLAGGFPCQPASLAGRRRGKEDERWLWPEFARLIGEIRPRIAFMENVPGILSLGGIHVAEDLAALGYDCEWGIMAAADAGAPHKRERWFCVAYCNHSRPTRTDDQIPAGRHSTDACRTASVSMGYAVLSRRGQEGLQHDPGALLAPRSTGNLAYSESQRDTTVQLAGQWSGAIESSIVGNPANSRLQESRPLGQLSMEAKRGTGLVVQVERPGGAIPGESVGRPAISWGERSDGAAQSVLGRAVDGLSRQLDGTRWPARPGEPQHEWEALRTAKGIPDRTKRLKALGNAVVPQVVYPIAVAIMEYLRESR